MKLKSSEDILKLIDDINKSIKIISQEIREDAKHLPDIHAINRISNNVEALKTLNYKLDIYIKILS